MQTDANLSLNKSQSRTSANVIISKWLHFLLLWCFPSVFAKFFLEKKEPSNVLQLCLVCKQPVYLYTFGTFLNEHRA
jgi:hypothetical protein